MSKDDLKTYGNYVPYFSMLRKLGLSPSECAVFGKIVNLTLNFGQAFVSLKDFAEELGYKPETISRALSKLVKAGLIRKTGKKKYGLFPYVEILPLPLSERSTTVDHPINEPCASDQPQENKEKEENKQTTKTEEVCLPKENCEEKLTQQKLSALGVLKNQAKHLIKTHSPEKIQSKLDQLTYQREHGAQITNPAGWLTSALKRDFKPCKAQAEQLQKIEDDKARDATNRAANLFLDAQFHEGRGNLELARALAKDSLKLKPLESTSKFMSKIEAQIEQRQKIQEARAKLSPAERERFFDEAMASLRAKHGNKFGDGLLTLAAQAEADKKMANIF